MRRWHRTGGTARIGGHGGAEFRLGKRWRNGRSHPLMTRRVRFFRRACVGGGEGRPSGHVRLCRLRGSAACGNRCADLPRFARRCGGVAPVPYQRVGRGMPDAGDRRNRRIPGRDPVGQGLWGGGIRVASVVCTREARKGHRRLTRCFNTLAGRCGRPPLRGAQGPGRGCAVIGPKRAGSVTRRPEPGPRNRFVRRRGSPGRIRRGGVACLRSHHRLQIRISGNPARLSAKARSGSWENVNGILLLMRRRGIHRFRTLCPTG